MNRYYTWTDYLYLLKSKSLFLLLRAFPIFFRNAWRYQVVFYFNFKSTDAVFHRYFLLSIHWPIISGPSVQRVWCSDSRCRELNDEFVLNLAPTTTEVLKRKWSRHNYSHWQQIERAAPGVWAVRFPNSNNGVTSASQYRRGAIM